MTVERHSKEYLRRKKVYSHTDTHMRSLAIYINNKKYNDFYTIAMSSIQSRENIAYLQPYA